MPRVKKENKETGKKATTNIKVVVSKLTDDYYSSGLLAEDFAELEPKDRLDVFVKLLQYVMPKLQAVAADIQSNTSTSLAERLAQLAKEAE